MGRGDFAINERKRRLQELEMTIRTQAKRDGVLSKKALIANIEFTTGLTKTKIQQYLDTLEAVGFIIIKGDEIQHLGAEEEL